MEVCSLPVIHATQPMFLCSLSGLLRDSLPGCNSRIAAGWRSFDCKHSSNNNMAMTNHPSHQGIMYLFNPPLALYFAKHPHHRPRSMWFGIMLVALGLIAAAFAKQAWTLILVQGVMYAFGGSK